MSPRQSADGAVERLDTSSGGAVGVVDARRRDSDPADLERLRQTVSGAPGSELSPPLAFLQEQGSYYRGTTSPVLASSFFQRHEGLFVPAATAVPTGPLDTMATYITFRELFDGPAGEASLVAWLKERNAGQVVAGCAALLSVIQAPNANLRAIGLDLAEVFIEKYEVLAKNLIRRGRVLVIPQAILKLAKMALMHCEGVESEAARHLDILIPLLVVQENLGARPRCSGSVLPGLAEDSKPWLIAELIRNQDFNQAMDESSALATFARRWLRLPDTMRSHPEYVDLLDAYRAATGASLQDVLAAAVALWSHAATGGGAQVIVGGDHLASLEGWSRERADAARRPFTIELEKLKRKILANPASADDDWSFDEFRRWPVIEWGERLIILSPRLLIDRTTGWPLVLDLRHFGKAKSPAQQRALNFFRQVCEAQVHESLEGVAGGSGSLRRFWSGDDLKVAFGVKNKVADAAVEYDEGWVVFEVTTSQFNRSAILQGDLDDIRRDIIRCVIAKARQLHVTVSRIREAEERLTGHKPAERRVFLPVLVLTEGIPLNPMTAACITEMLEVEGLLQDPDVLPLEILDSADLDMLEGVLSHGSGTALNYLRSHGASTLSRMPFNTWLLDAHGPHCQRADRITSLMNEGFAYAGEALGVLPGEDDKNETAE